MPPSPSLDCYAIVAPGLEAIAAQELRAIGVQVGAVEPGGVSFTADLAGLYAANLQARTVSRVVRRLATFRAASFHELERHAKRVPWASVLPGGVPASFHVTSRKSKLYHQRAIAQRLAVAAGVPESDTDEDGGQVFIVRVFRDAFTISADASGELLHRRGYRLATAKAPLRETLAAGMLLAAGWDGSVPLLDPMCGSGTLPIEATLLARRIAPGLGRGFAFERWPEFDADVWRSVVAATEARVLPRAPAPILASDRDAGAIAAAIENAARAGVAGDVQFDRQAISAVAPPAGAGFVVSNPPYGGRVGDISKLRDLYAQFGNVMRRQCAGWQVALLSAHRELEYATRLPFETRLSLSNGGIRVRLVHATVPGAQAPIVSPPKIGNTSPVM